MTTICKRYSDSNERVYIYILYSILYIYILFSILFIYIYYNYIYIHTVIMFCSRQNTWGASCCPSVGVYLPSKKSSIHLHLPISTINSLSYKLYSYQFIIFIAIMISHDLNRSRHLCSPFLHHNSPWGLVPWYRSRPSWRISRIASTAARTRARATGRGSTARPLA